MKRERRPEGSASPAFGAWTGAVLLLGAAVSGVWLRLGLPVPGCGFRAWSGVPCMTCGSTRMLRALWAGDPLQALTWNPLVFSALTILVAWSLLSTVRLVFGVPRRRLVLDARERRVLRILAIVAALAGWCYAVSIGSS